MLKKTIDYFFPDRKRTMLIDISKDFLDFSIMWTVLSWLWAIIKFIFFYILVNTIFSTPKVFSGSMTPSLETNDIVLMSSCYFSLKAPLIEKDIYCFNKPKLGDIVAFTVPTYSSNNKTMTFTKRILGCPGDTIQYVGGRLSINGKLTKIKYISEYSFVENNKKYKGFIYEETLPNGVKYQILHKERFSTDYFDNTEKFVLGENEYFCGGDNRNDSADSRSMLGKVKRKDIIGKAIMIIISHGNINTLSIRSLINGLKWQRCFTWLI